MTRPFVESVKGEHVTVWNSAPSWMEDRHGFTKQGHGRHYIAIDDGINPHLNYVDKAWDRRCDASRWAKRNGAKSIKHWYLI